MFPMSIFFQLVFTVVGVACLHHLPVSLTQKSNTSTWEPTFFFLTFFLFFFCNLQSERPPVHPFVVPYFLKHNFSLFFLLCILTLSNSNYHTTHLIQQMCCAWVSYFSTTCVSSNLYVAIG